MKRRQFLQNAALGFTAVSLPELPRIFAETRMGVVVHSYAIRGNPKVESSKYPGFQNALDLMEHCHQIGAGGVQVVVKDWSADFAEKVRDRREKLGMYLEGSIGLPKTTADVATFEKEVKNAKEAGAHILRTVTLGGRRYEVFRTADAFREFKKNAVTSLQLAEPVLKKHRVKLAVENHKDMLAPELAEVLKQIGSEWVGATLDFGNNIALLEDPMEVVQALMPYLVSTHIKDMAVEEYDAGFLLSEVPLGKGMLDLPKMITLCKQHNPNMTFNLEMITRDPLEIPCLNEAYWATFSDRPGSDLARTLQMVRKNKPRAALPRVAKLSLEEKLAAEEANIVQSFEYWKQR
ncbi:MAG: TIM barrel protein [Spirosomataceae bacterium]